MVGKPRNKHFIFRLNEKVSHGHLGARNMDQPPNVSLFLRYFHKPNKQKHGFRRKHVIPVERAPMMVRAFCRIQGNLPCASIPRNSATPRLPLSSLRASRVVVEGDVLLQQGVEEPHRHVGVEPSAQSPGSSQLIQESGCMKNTNRALQLVFWWCPTLFWC